MIVYGHVLEPSTLRILFEEVSHKARYGFGSVLLKAIFGGWLVAMSAWLVAAFQDTTSGLLRLLPNVFDPGGRAHTLHRGHVRVPHR